MTKERAERLVEWKLDGDWHELWIDGVSVGCIREGTRRASEWFIAPYGRPPYSRSGNLDDAKRSLERYVTELTATLMEDEG